jgi:GST-like protein
VSDITLYYSSTPNGHKVVVMLEELGAPYDIHHIDIERGDQFEPWYDEISPNNRMPAIVDRAPEDGGEPLSVFESGAILYYLANKYDRFLPSETRPRTRVMEWLFWQVGGIGPMAGQAHHFIHYAPEKLEYAIERYVDECARLYSVLDNQLADGDYVAGAYSIADIACWGWIMRHERHHQKLSDFPNIERWFGLLESRAAIARTREIAGQYQGVSSNVSDDTRSVLFTPRKKPR